MPEYIIAGTVIKFPFEPYEVQRNYMEKVILCLRDSTNGVLESPTGTGKTLSLLCSSLAWLLSKKEELKANVQNTIPEPDDDNRNEIKEQKGEKEIVKAPKIIYASRTHSQLAQAVQELKRTSYSFMNAVVLGSRDQLCINPNVMAEQENANKIQMCKYLVQNHKCSFLLRNESRKTVADFCDSSIMDIEDLVKVGQQLKMCPYYAAKQLVEEADIVFMPYNYLFEHSARKANKIEISNSICILDEAHNIEKICEESASAYIKSSDVAVAIEDTLQVREAVNLGKIDLKKSESDLKVSDLDFLNEMLLKLQEAIDNIKVNEREGDTFQAEYIFDLLSQANLNFESSKVIIDLLDKLVQLMVIESQNNHLLRKGDSVLKVSKFLDTVFNCDKESMHKVYRSFKVHVQIEEPKQPYGVNGWVRQGFGMEQLLKRNPRSVILTSGTLSPIKPLIAELCLPVGQRLENPHIVPSSQVYCKILGYGPDNERLESDYKNRGNPKYIHSLGSTILNVARIVPDGLLVFFPSYPLLNQCANTWRASGLWAEISRHKPIFIEPRGKDEFIKIMESFYDSINNSKGACFLAVCRGKVSEGLDFADRNGRAVIITGLPLPPLKDPKVILKRKYLDENHTRENENRTRENELLTGTAWYSLEATRAVNQAIGRVIRHHNDYGAILLCDIRFQRPTQVKQLSKWVRDILGTSPNSSAFGPLVKELTDFYKYIGISAGKSQKCCNKSLISDLTQKSDDAEVVQGKYPPGSKEILSEVILTEEKQPMSPKDYNTEPSIIDTVQDSKEIMRNENRYQSVHNEIIVIEDDEYSVPSGSPKDYVETSISDIFKDQNDVIHDEVETSISDNVLDTQTLFRKYFPASAQSEVNQTKFQNANNDIIKIKKENAIELETPYDDAETSISNHFEEVDTEVHHSKYIPNTSKTTAKENNFQNAPNEIIIIEDQEEQSIPSSNDSTSTTEQTCGSKLSSAIDNSTILPSCSSCPSQNFVKIHKRDHSPLSQTNSICSNKRETINLKKIKLEQSWSSNTTVDATASSPLSSSSSSQLSNSSIQTQSVNNPKVPKSRAGFMGYIRRILPVTDYNNFTKALVDYKDNNDTIDNLLDVLFGIFGKPNLLYVLNATIRFLKPEHLVQFDERIADLCCVYNEEEFQSIPISNQNTFNL
ncbi:regulator of telomere elongation helicase 1 homolog [Lucilia sericata]|uniref:regulator of telomere elongation helicase 1 homolog n=1 Tax=Lucilia sericata TaxID=13632 RepID=UPI0018A84283|nr:regulator of telomere elongation helicase 1 homolog [Lucilia sericata]